MGKAPCCLPVDMVSGMTDTLWCPTVRDVEGSWSLFQLVQMQNVPEILLLSLSSTNNVLDSPKCMHVLMWSLKVTWRRIVPDQLTWIKLTSNLCRYILNCRKGCQALHFIITIQIQILTSMHSCICPLYTALLTVFQTAAILRCGEKLLQMLQTSQSGFNFLLVI